MQKSSSHNDKFAPYNLTIGMEPSVTRRADFMRLYTKSSDNEP